MRDERDPARQPFFEVLHLASSGHDHRVELSERSCIAMVRTPPTRRLMGGGHQSRARPTRPRDQITEGFLGVQHVYDLWHSSSDAPGCFQLEHERRATVSWSSSKTSTRPGDYPGGSSWQRPFPFPDAVVVQQLRFQLGAEPVVSAVAPHPCERFAKPQPGRLVAFVFNNETVPDRERSVSHAWSSSMGTEGFSLGSMTRPSPPPQGNCEDFRSHDASPIHPGAGETS